MNRHPPTQADFDNGDGSCHGRTSFDGGLLMKVAEPEPPARTAGFCYRLPSDNTSFRHNVLKMMIDG